MKLTSLNPAQVSLLESFAGIQSQEEINELTRVIRDYYAKKLEDELEKLWDEGTYNQETLDELRGQHLRTAYKK